MRGNTHMTRSQSMTSATAVADAIWLATQPVFQAPPSLTPLTAILPRVVTAVIISGLGMYSAYSYWVSSHDFAKLIAAQLGINSTAFVKWIGLYFALSGVFSNGCQSTVILLQQLLGLFTKTSKAVHYLLNQETWLRFIKRNWGVLIISVLAAFSVVPIGFVTNEDDGLVNAILIGMLVFLISCRGIGNFTGHMPTSPNQTHRQKTLKKAQLLIAARLEQSLQEFLQLSRQEQQSTLNELALEYRKYNQNLLAKLLNLPHYTKRNSGEYLTVTKPSLPRRIFIVLALLTVPFQIGYALLAYVAGKTVHLSLAVLALLIAILDYGGLAWDATEELARKTFDGQKTLSSILAPTLYFLAKICIFALGPGAGATLGLYNYRTLTKHPLPISYNQTNSDCVFDAPPSIALTAEIIGFASDSFSNTAYAIELAALLIQLWAAYCSTNKFNKSLARLDDAINTLANLFKDMDSARFDEWLTTSSPEESLVPKGVLYTLFQQNGIPRKDVKTLFNPPSTSSNEASTIQGNDADDADDVDDVENCLLNDKTTYGTM